MEIQGVEVKWMGHACFKLKKDNYVVYVDPYKLPDDAEKADVILITHEHFDHLSPEDILKIAKERTFVIASNGCQKKLRSLEDNIGVAIYMVPGEVTDAGKVNITSFPAYNLNKFREEGVPFHPKEDNKLSLKFRFGGVTFYHMGDMDNIPELADVKNVDVAFVPVSGTYVMTAEEAAEAVDVFNPKIAIPMHYGSIVGSKEDAERFKELANCEVRILG